MTGISHRIVDLLDPEVVKSAKSSADRFKIEQTLRSKGHVMPDNIARIEKVAEFHGLAAIDYWRFAFDSEQDNQEKKKLFRNICRRSFSLMEVCPVPEDPIRRIIHVLKMIAYAYLGEKWEDVMRYLKDNYTKLEIELTDDLGWNYRLLVSIYRAILFLTGRNSGQDLQKSMDIIADLRRQQKMFEEGYFESIGAGQQKTAAHQIASLYHLAKSVELVGEYMLRGTPTGVENLLDAQFENAILHSQTAEIVDLEIVIKLLEAALKQMTHNSVWTAAFNSNPMIAEFVESMTKSENPVFEFLYPQKMAIQENGLLDTTKDAIIVNLPTSSGKTLMAEFKILEAISSFGRTKKIVYVVPTRMLVNQITTRLRRDLGTEPLGLKIEKVSGAVEIDGFEDGLLSAMASFDVLVTTPEKLQLLIRNPRSQLAESIGLTIIDEAHNLEDSTRGLSLEVLLSIIKTDCKESRFLLLTPFIPNGDEIAKWLSPQKSRSIGMELNWKPNDLAVGICYAEGRGREISTFFKPLLTSRETILLDEHIRIGDASGFSKTAGEVKKIHYKLASLIATQLDPSQNFLILARTVPDTWNAAKLIYENLRDESDIPEEIILVQKFIKSELGESFPLAKYLGKRIGVHHAGLPDDVKSLVEWLMEDGHLRVLISTTTVAQGVNFPVSGILVSSYTYTNEDGSSIEMPSRDFWNLLGRAGRIDQPTLGVVGIMIGKQIEDDESRAARYLRKQTKELTSVLVRMVKDALDSDVDLDLSRLVKKDSSWSSFVQYIAHMKNQSESLGSFIAESEFILKQTYGYGRLDPEKQEKLRNAVNRYAEKLDGEQHESYLSDLTGFAPESIERAMVDVANLDMEESDWSAERLFSPASDRLAPLIGIMLNSITEVKNLSKIIDDEVADKQNAIGLIISDWVYGRRVEEIARRHFGNKSDSITACVKAIYGRIVNLATWGLAGIQKIASSGLELEDISKAQKWRVANLPAMIFYGVDSEDAILMRRNGVPRSVARRIGRAYMNEYGEQDPYLKQTADVLAWLDRLPEEMWQPESMAISGPECKRVWRKLSGKYSDERKFVQT